MRTLERALQTLLAGSISITTDVDTGPTGVLRATESAAGKSPGATAFFTLHQVKLVLACDRYQHVSDNVSHLAQAASALHTLDRILPRAVFMTMIEALATEVEPVPKALTPNVPHWTEREAGLDG